MPASSEAVLFDYYGAIPAAFATALATVYSGDSVQLLTQRTLQGAAEKKTTPRVEISLRITGSPEHHSYDRSNVEYRDTRQGQVIFRCITRRDGSGQSLGTLVGKLLANLRKGKTLITSSNLAYYEVIYLEESGGEEDFEVENDEIALAIAADIEFQIKPTEFPVS